MSPNFKKPPKTFILEASKPGAGGSWTFVGPEQVILAMTPEEVSPALEAINKAMARGLTLAGYVSYEAAFVLEPKLAHLIPEQRQLPLIWLIAYGSAQALSRSDVEVCFDNRKPITLGTLTHSLPRATYLKRIEDILEYIRAGDIYQANFTFQYQATLSGSPKDLYAALRHTQPVPYGGFIEGEDWAILSSSPELFFEIRENRITSRPMKGTALRQPASATDAQEVDQLKRDPKQRSENLMILDLIRNDLSRICVPGSVKVPSRFDIESYRTLHQMTSTVEGTLSPKIRLEDILKAIFPCGSITGAPKIRAMEILSELETAPRGIYTGALGMIAPDGSAQFNVAIRTAYLEQCRDTEWQLEVGVGGGIVHDSTPEGEWAECQTKLKFLDLAEQGEKAGDFDLIETLRWSNEQGFDLFARHLDRLKATADYFSYPLDIDQVKLELKRCVEGSPSEPQWYAFLLPATAHYLSREHHCRQSMQLPGTMSSAKTPFQKPIPTFITRPPGARSMKAPLLPPLKRAAAMRYFLSMKTVFLPKVPAQISLSKRVVCSLPHLLRLVCLMAHCAENLLKQEGQRKDLLRLTI